MSASPSAPASATALFAHCSVIPVIRIADMRRAVDLAHTLVEAGLPLMEITLRTPTALDVIERIASEVPQAVVGAGTIRTAEDLARAADKGARFAISPGCTETLYRAAEQVSMPLIPGVATVSEVMRGMEFGHDLFKFFPAGAAGGQAMLRAWAGPLPQARFVPTGGVSPENAAEYLALPNVVAVGGSWMVPESGIESGDWARIGDLARACADLRSLL